MRRIVTGIDDFGRSCVVETEPILLEASGKSSLKELYITPSSPPPSRPGGHADSVDLRLASGFVRWLTVEFEPNTVIPMHHTDSIDLDLVVEGSVELGLDDGRHMLNPGDCAVVTGVDHYWQTGTIGCRMIVTNIGTPPAEVAGATNG